MRRLLTLLLLALLTARPAAAQTGPAVTIDSPGEGQVLRGQVTVTGASTAEGFRSAELAFAYADDPTGTWFLIRFFDGPATGGTLAVWDTEGLTDGDYTLRLRVTLQDGSQVEALVEGLRVRNTTPVETATPLATLALGASPLPATSVPTATLTWLPTPTHLPANPASLGLPQVYASIGRGALSILLLFLVFGLFLRMRRAH
jgi:hypothetical protein